MSTGESLIIIVILLGLGFGIYKIHQKKKWKLVGKFASVIIGIILLISAGFYINNVYKNRPQEVSSLAGISLGMKKVDVTVKKGKPDLENMNKEGETTLYYKGYSGIIKNVISLDSKNEVYRICSFEYSDEVFGLGVYDSLENIIKKLDEPQGKSINKDGTKMILTYPQYNVAFQIYEGNIDMTCVTTQEKISFFEEYLNN